AAVLAQEAEQELAVAAHRRRGRLGGLRRAGARAAPARAQEVDVELTALARVQAQVARGREQLAYVERPAAQQERLGERVAQGGWIGAQAVHEQLEHVVATLAQRRD